MKTNYMLIHIIQLNSAITVEQKKSKEKFFSLSACTANSNATHTIIYTFQCLYIVMPTCIEVKFRKSCVIAYVRVERVEH